MIYVELDLSGTDTPISELRRFVEMTKHEPDDTPVTIGSSEIDNPYLCDVLRVETHGPKEGN